MTRTAFLCALAWQLTLAGVPFIRPELEAFVDDVWPLAEEDPDPSRWAREFLRGERASREAHHRELLAAVRDARDQAKKTLQQSQEIVDGFRAALGPPRWE
jgi:hypothetical protein